MLPRQRRVEGGYVRVNYAGAGQPACVGYRAEAYAGERTRVLEVVQLIAKRVSALRSPPSASSTTARPPPREAYVPPLFSRERGTGRPTKKDGRQLERFRDR